MALKFKEHDDSGDGSLGRSAGDVYRLLVWGDPVDDDADNEQTVMLAAIQRFSQVSVLGNILDNFDRKRIAPGMWIITATYCSPTDLRQSTSTQYSFTTSGGSQHISHSRQTVGIYALPGVTAANYQGAINVSANNTVDGVDIGPGTASGPGVAEFKTTHYLPIIPQGLVDFLFDHPCVVSNSTAVLSFDGITRSYKQGELQLQYAEGSKRSGIGDFELTLHWASSPNRTNFQVGNITVDTKNGWDYLWVACGPDADPDAMAIIPQPTAAYVERVYEYQNLNMILAMLNTPGNSIWQTGAPAGGITIPTLTIPRALF